MNYPTKTNEMASPEGAGLDDEEERAARQGREASASPFGGAAVGSHYDRLDRLQREIWGEHVHHGLWRTRRDTPEQATRTLVDIVAARAQIASGMRVTDIGCGYGATARILARERGAHVTGITISQAQFWYADANNTEPDEKVPKVQFVLGDWLNNDLPSESQDALIAIESTEHMADKARVYQEAFRVLKPGGRIVVCALTAAAGTTPWQRRHVIEPLCREASLAGVDREEDHVRWMTEAGLSVTARDDVSTRVSPTWSRCARRALWMLFTRPGKLRRLMKDSPGARGFARALPRVWLGYRNGALRYVIYCACRPPTE